MKKFFKNNATRLLISSLIAIPISLSANMDDTTTSNTNSTQRQEAISSLTSIIIRNSPKGATITTPRDIKHLQPVTFISNEDIILKESVKTSMISIAIITVLTFLGHKAKHHWWLKHNTATSSLPLALASGLLLGSCIGAKSYYGLYKHTFEQLVQSATKKVKELAANELINGTHDIAKINKAFKASSWPLAKAASCFSGYIADLKKAEKTLSHLHIYVENLSDKEKQKISQNILNSIAQIKDNDVPKLMEKFNNLIDAIHKEKNYEKQFLEQLSYDSQKKSLLIDLGAVLMIVILLIGLDKITSTIKNALIPQTT